MLTEFQHTWAERYKILEEKERARIGDVYDECERRGCDRQFLKASSGRMELSPLKQTLTLIALYERETQKNGCIDKYSLDYICQWKIYLEVLVERRPMHEMWSEWDQSLQIMNEKLPMF
ncbi:MAG: hypothetical protein IJ955_10385 [Oscillospiraceae bacterium]|nr:hypothetical protein [Oscillospiraceae bacterium]